MNKKTIALIAVTLVTVVLTSLLTTHANAETPKPASTCGVTTTTAAAVTTTTAKKSALTADQTLETLVPTLMTIKPPVAAAAAPEASNSPAACNKPELPGADLWW